LRNVISTATFYTNDLSSINLLTNLLLGFYVGLVVKLETSLRRVTWRCTTCAD